MSSMASIDQYWIVQKKLDEKNIFSWRKNIFKILIFEKKIISKKKYFPPKNFKIFRSEKSKIKIFTFFNNKKWKFSKFSLFFENENFRNYFSPRWKNIFPSILFVRSGIWLYFRFWIGCIKIGFIISCALVVIYVVR